MRPLALTLLHSSIVSRPDETRILLTSFLDDLRFSADVSPLHRAKAARWLAYPLLHPTTTVEEEEATAPEAQLAEPWAFLDALRLSCALCCEMALGDTVTTAAAHHMLTNVLTTGGQ